MPEREGGRRGGQRDGAVVGERDASSIERTTNRIKTTGDGGAFDEWTRMDEDERRGRDGVDARDATSPSRTDARSLAKTRDAPLEGSCGSTRGSTRARRTGHVARHDARRRVKRREATGRLLATMRRTDVRGRARAEERESRGGGRAVAETRFESDVGRPEEARAGGGECASDATSPRGSRAFLPRRNKPGGDDFIPRASASGSRGVTDRGRREGSRPRAAASVPTARVDSDRTRTEPRVHSPRAMSDSDSDREEREDETLGNVGFARRDVSLFAPAPAALRVAIRPISIRHPSPSSPARLRVSATRR